MRARSLRCQYPGMRHHSVVSWTALMLGCVESGEEDVALEVLSKMRRENCAPNARTFSAALKACCGLAAKEQDTKVGRWFFKAGTLEKGMEIHGQAVDSHQVDIIVASSLIDMYAECGCPGHAREVFERMPQHDVVSLVSLMLGYVENGQPELALLVFSSSSTGSFHNAVVFVAALKACTGVAYREEGTKLAQVLDTGMEIHSRARKAGLESVLHVSSSLIGFYAACHDMVDARKVFDKVEFHSVVLWNTLLLGYAENGEEDLASDLYVLLEAGDGGGIDPDVRTVGAVLKASGVLAAREVGEEVDGRVVKTKSLEKAMFVRARSGLSLFPANSLVDLFGKCGAMVEAQRTFERMPAHSGVSWTALVQGYVENNEESLALELFSFMPSPDALGYVAALKACIKFAAKETGKHVVKLRSLDKCLEIHAQAAGAGWDGDLILATTLIDTYSTCGSVIDSRGVFDRMEFHNVVAWSVLMRSYTDNAEEQISLGLFSVMEDAGVLPNAVTYVSALQACSALALTLEVKKDTRGKTKTEFREMVVALHSRCIAVDLESDIFVGSSLVQLYMDSGSLVDARELFNRLPFHSLVLWNSLILGYTENGEASTALELFSRMQLQGDDCLPDARSLMAALKTCGSLVALEAARGIHGCVLRNGMEDEPLLASLIDTYGKCGAMTKARQIFDSFSPAGTKLLELWNALIGGYSCQGNAKFALEIFGRMRDEQVEPNRITLAAILTTCNHAGLVETGKSIFSSMDSKFGISPTAEHYLCVIDMLGRANQLDAAVKTLEAMPVKKVALGWTSVLSSCKKWKNVELGEVAFKALLNLGTGEMEPASYVLMAGIYELEY